VSIDGIVVAQLHGWEYTSFPVSEGPHRIGVIYKAKELYAYRDVVAEAGSSYFFDVNLLVLGRQGYDFYLTPVDRIGGSFPTGGKTLGSKTYTFVAPGTGGK
jgi:hypothetical protein